VIRRRDLVRNKHFENGFGVSLRHSVELFRRSKPILIIILLVLTVVSIVGKLDAQTTPVKTLRIRKGQSSILVRGILRPRAKQLYRLSGRAGQRLRVRLVSSRSSFEAFDAVLWVQSRKYYPGNKDTLLLEGVDRHGMTDWSGTLPITGEYEVIISNPDVSDHPIRHSVHYKLEVEIE